MAKVFLEPNALFTVTDGKVSVFGSHGIEAVLLAAGAAGVVLDQNVERVQFAGSAAVYRYAQAGNQLLVYDEAASLLATIPLQGDSDGTRLSFAEGNVDAKLESGGVLTVGGEPVGATPAALALPASAFAAPTFTLASSAAYTIVEEGRPITFTITPDGVVAADTVLTLKLDHLTAGIPEGPASPWDFAPNPLTVSFTAGDSAAKTVSVVVVEDGQWEDNELYGAYLLDSQSNGLDSVSGSISDPQPRWIVSANTSSLGEGETLIFTVSSPLASTEQVSVPYILSGSATPGIDYTGATASGALTMPAGSSSVSLILNTTADHTPEGLEDITINLGVPWYGKVLDGTASAVLLDTSVAPAVVGVPGF
jgi:hypothetical protein